jgi:hypothetical protein
VLIEKLEASRRYAESEMRIRAIYLSGSTRTADYETLEKLLAERRALIGENRTTGVILSSERGLR